MVADTKIALLEYGRLEVLGFFVDCEPWPSFTSQSVKFSPGRRLLGITDSLGEYHGILSEYRSQPGCDCE